jgi:hypothetical protein
MKRVGLVRALLAVAVSMTMGEFIEVQKLSPEDLRKRFGLAATCDPAVTALTTEPAANRVMVAIECRAKPAGAPASGAPGQRPSSPRPQEKGGGR